MMKWRKERNIERLKEQKNMILMNDDERMITGYWFRELNRIQMDTDIYIEIDIDMEIDVEHEKQRWTKLTWPCDGKSGSEITSEGQLKRT
jgi:hypothetical protein